MLLKPGPSQISPVPVASGGGGMFDAVGEEDLASQSCGPSRWMGQRRGIPGGINSYRHLRKEVQIAAAMTSFATAKKGLQVHFIIHYF